MTLVWVMVTIKNTCRVLLRQKRYFINWISKIDYLFFLVQSAFNKFFDNSFLNTAKTNTGYPKSNLYQTFGETKLIFSIPGLKFKNLYL